MITKEMVRPGAVVVDVGLSRVCHLGKNVVVGDVSREVREVSSPHLSSAILHQVASLVTPVPGGVGPCTVACLMANTTLAAKTAPSLEIAATP